jgi:hypothetical protein
LGKTSPNDELALFLFDAHSRALITFEQWNAMPASERAAVATGKLAEASPGWQGTDLGSALVSAAETLSDTSGKPSPKSREIIVVSDLQEGSRLESLLNYEWPKGIALTVEPVRPTHESNAGLQLVANPEDSKPGDNPGVRVRVSNEAGSTKEQFKVGWAQPGDHSFQGKPVEIYVPAGQSRTAMVPLPSPAIAVDRIILQGDDDDFDNTVFVVPPEQTRLTVLYFGNDSENDPKGSLYFLKRAFQDTQRQSVQVLPRSEKQPVPPQELSAASLLVITAPLDQSRIELLHDQVMAGKTLLISLASEQMGMTLARLLGQTTLAVEPGTVRSYAMLGDIDFRHPMFAAFSDPRFSDFTKIHFWKYWKFDPGSISGARVLAKFDDGDPAVVEAPVGKGRLIILASGWAAEDSQLALSTKFVPLVYALVEQSSGIPQLPAQFLVGDSLPIAAAAGIEHQNLTIKIPDGSDVTIGANETNFSNTLRPGIYRISAHPPRRFAVNLDAAESRTAPMSPDELEKRGVPVSTPVASKGEEARHPERLQNAELENRQKLWRDLLIAAIALLLIESWLAGKTARRELITV